MKKFAFFILVMIIGISSLITLAEEEKIEVFLDGELIEFDVRPEIVNNRTMVPLRGIFEAFDMNVDWHQREQMVDANKDNLNIQLSIGSDFSSVNGRNHPLDSKPYISNNRMMVPLRFIAESTGADVKWDGENKRIDISTDVSSEVIADTLTYKIVDTGVETYYTDNSIVSYISEGHRFYGQDAHYEGYQPSYQDNGDGTVTDLVTGLMWQQTMDEKMTYEDALLYANDSKLGGYSDWRIPTIKELFSLILFTGQSGGEVAKELYIDTDYFDQPIGDTSIGEREIDAQVWSSTEYVSTTMHGDATIFGVNFVDGRIKGYGLTDPKTRGDNKGYFRLVRGNEDYGLNNFVNNGDGTVTDLATGLMWQLADDGQTRDWEEALDYAENLELAGYDDWRLPDIKELQSIVDYSKSVATTNSPAIDDMFSLTEIIDPNGDTNYGFYWSSTTHQDGMNIADGATYVAFGQAQGQMFGDILDVHGCGAVRSDPKSGNASDYPQYFGPQGDIRYVYNYVIAVRSL